MSNQQFPTLGRIVHYRAKYGRQTMRAAVVTATASTLDPDGVDAGDVPALDSGLHVHLWVFTPAQTGPNAAAGGFAEFNIGPGAVGPDGEIEPGTWRWPLIHQRVESEGAEDARQ